MEKKDEDTLIVFIVGVLRSSLRTTLRVVRFRIAIV
jgi:hypothetical protein